MTDLLRTSHYSEGLDYYLSTLDKSAVPILAANLEKMV